MNKIPTSVHKTQQSSSSGEVGSARTDPQQTFTQVRVYKSVTKEEKMRENSPATKIVRSTAPATNPVREKSLA